MSGAVAPRRALRVGHKGADLIAPGNTFASFRAALAAGVDMIEFDVVSERPDGSGQLLLAHDLMEPGDRPPHTLEEGLAHFAGEAYARVQLNVDLKLPGYERRVLEALERHGLLHRALLSTMELASLRAIRATRPQARLGLSVPRVRRDPWRRRDTAALALAAIAVLRRTLPGRCARLVRAGVADAIMAHWSVVTPRLVARLREAGGELFVWTVDDPGRIAWLEALGVDGITTNDPRLFAGSGPGTRTVSGAL
ncbi:MAG: glycerophosphodiester phosphodiesterase [Actinomycetota bacterium]|nr:glycerophosphodiester phosphodiesterase [Actinomycetota bacterium]